MAVHTDGFDVRLYLRGDVGAVGWNLDFMDVRRDVMATEEIFAGVAFLLFVGCVVYVFKMALEEAEKEGEE